jgi:hypothetical protein
LAWFWSEFRSRSASSTVSMIPDDPLGLSGAADPLAFES